MEDNKIVLLYFERNEKAIIETKNKYGNYCYTISYNILKNHEDSEECVNDTYIKAWNSIPPQEPTSLMAYLAKIVRNLSFNIYRKNNTAKRGSGETNIVLDELSEIISSNNNIEDDLINKEQQKLLSKTINEFLRFIDKTSCNIMIRRYFYSESVIDISKRYNFTESKVKSILFRNRNKLKKFLKERGIIL